METNETKYFPGALVAVMVTASKKENDQIIGVEGVNLDVAPTALSCAELVKNGYSFSLSVVRKHFISRCQFLLVSGLARQSSLP